MDKKYKHIAQGDRHAAYVVNCRCGGRIKLYTTELGTCNRCGNDFMVWKAKTELHVTMLQDHRRDLF